MLEPNVFDLAQAGHLQSLYKDNFKPDVGAYSRIGEHSKWRKPKERSMKGLSYSRKTVKQSFAPQTALGGIREGNLEERYYVRHFRMYEIGNGETNRRFP